MQMQVRAFREKVIRLLLCYLLPTPLSRAVVAGFIFLGMLSKRFSFVGPRIIHLTLPASCNHNCVFCITDVHGQGSIAGRKVLDFEGYCQVVASAIDNGTQHFLISSQGEPFLYPNLKELIEFILKYSRGRAQVQIVTNATLLDRVGVEFLIQNKIKLWVSLHAGVQEVWDKIHRPIGASRFEKMKSDIRTICLANAQLVTLHSVINKFNLNELSGIAKFASEVGGKKIFFGKLYSFEPFQLEAVDEQNLKLQIDDAERNATAHNIEHNLATVRELALISKPKVLQTPVFPPATNHPKPFYHKNDCFIPWLISAVTDEGVVMGCGKGRIFGSLFENDWGHLLHSNFKSFAHECTRISKTKNNVTGCQCAECPHIQMNAIANKWVQRFSIF